MSSLAEYQQAFTAYIRNPKGKARPQGVNAKRMDIYPEIVFNNIQESVSVCFPVLISIITKRQWRQLCRDFFSQHQHSSPLFREIPRAFLDYLETTELAPALKQLAHYEWAELCVSNMADSSSMATINNLLDDPIMLTHAHMLLSYDYPVHMLSKSNPPREQKATFILMYRDRQYHIQFIALNAVTYQLLLLIQQGSTARQALTYIAQTLQQNPDNTIAFGVPILEDLQAQGVF